MILYCNRGPAPIDENAMDLNSKFGFTDNSSSVSGIYLMFYIYYHEIWRDLVDRNVLAALEKYLLGHGHVLTSVRKINIIYPFDSSSVLIQLTGKSTLGWNKRLLISFPYVYLWKTTVTYKDVPMSTLISDANLIFFYLFQSSSSSTLQFFMTKYTIKDFSMAQPPPSYRCKFQVAKILDKS